MKRVFIDGSAGTTGLRIKDRLALRQDIELITLCEEQRKDVSARRQALNTCDIAFLCLPDDAARESVSLVENPDVVVLDTSTAHRTDPAWAYGFPELSPEHWEKVRTSKRIAVPGCHASGFIALVYPLVVNGILRKEALLADTSVTGYSGGGKNMIAAYESPDRDPGYSAPRQYALGQQHKHLKEMKAITGLENAPAFIPLVCDFYSGMEVTVPVFERDLMPGVTMQDIKEIYRSLYAGGIVKYVSHIDDSGYISAGHLSGKDSMEISVEGREDCITLISVYDNLGKGASGAAIECMNIVMGAEPATGLDL